METFRTYTYMDTYGRLNVVSSTQVPFHIRRILANALDIPKWKVRVIKPRIGGGFGAKQTSVSEVYPALVTWKTGKPAKILYTREESFIASSPRHEMEMHVRLGADKDGIIKGIDLYTPVSYTHLEEKWMKNFRKYILPGMLAVLGGYTVMVRVFFNMAVGRKSYIFRAQTEEKNHWAPEVRQGVQWLKAQPCKKAEITSYDGLRLQGRLIQPCLLYTSRCV